MTKIFHAPILTALETFVRNPSNVKALYDTVEQFCIDNFKIFDDESKSADLTVDMYDDIKAFIDKANSNSETRAIVDKVNISRFIQAILFKESVRTNNNLKQCTVKQFQEILYYYQNRLGGADYKKYQSEFEEVFYKVYLALNKADIAIVEKYLNDPDLSYRLKKMMKSAVQLAHQQTAGRANVTSTLLQSLESTQKKITQDVTSVTTPAKSGSKSSKVTPKKVPTKPAAVKPDDKVEQAASPKDKTELEASAALDQSDTAALKLQINDKVDSVYLIESMVRSSVGFGDVVNEIIQAAAENPNYLKESNTELANYASFSIALVDNPDSEVVGMLKDVLFKAFMDNVAKPLAEQFAPKPDPMQEQYNNLLAQVQSMHAGMMTILGAVEQFGQSLKKAK